MTGADLRAIRQRVGATHQQIAEAAGVPPSDVENWELFGEVPRKYRFAIDRTLWELERDKALAASGLPDCGRFAEIVAGDGPLDQELVAAHLADCEVCRARETWLDAHVRPMPIGGSPLMVAYGFIDRLNGWQRSAAAGATIIVGMGGIAVVGMLLRAVLHREPAYAGFAVGLLALFVVSGVAGGIVHHLTAPLRKWGVLGYYGSNTLAVLAYLATAMVGLVILSTLAVGVTAEDLSEFPSFDDPILWLIALIVSVIFGIVLGRMLRGPRPTDDRTPPRRRIFSGRNFARTLGGVAVILTAGSVLIRIADTFWVLPWGTPTSAEDWEAMLPELRAAVEANPESPEAVRELAWALWNVEYWEEAEPVLREAVRLDPTDPDLVAALGWWELQSGDEESAVALLEDALAIEPDHTIARQNLGWAYYRLDRLEEAELAYRRILLTNPDNDVAHGVLGRILIMTNRTDQAEESLREAIRLNRSDPEYHQWLAQARMRNGNLPGALESLRTATRLAPEDPAGWYEIGRLAHIVGEYEESSRAFERLYNIFPEGVDSIPEVKVMWEASRLGKPVESIAPELAELPLYPWE